MNLCDVNPNDELLIGALGLIRSKLPKKPPDMAYQWAYDFVLRHGVFFQARPIPKGVRQGAQKQCFGNAYILAATKGLRYIEGYCLGPHSPLPELHGWNADKSGNLIDSTWMNTGLSYRGVEFSLERADDAICNGDSCVLDDFMRHWPIFDKEWHGEDWQRQWPVSKRLKLLRAGKIWDVMKILSAELENAKS